MYVWYLVKLGKLVKLIRQGGGGPGRKAYKRLDCWGLAGCWAGLESEENKLLPWAGWACVWEAFPNKLLPVCCGWEGAVVVEAEPKRPPAVFPVFCC